MRRLRSNSENPVHCAELANDGFVYVCDRVNDRIQVFTKDGKFVKEQWIQKDSLADGSVWDIAFSKDPQQKYIFLADGRNMKVHIIERLPLQELTSLATADGSRANSTASTASRSHSKGTSHDRDLRR